MRNSEVRFAALVVLGVALFAAGATVVAVGSQGTQPQPANATNGAATTVSTSGTATVSAEPDLAVVRLTSVATASDPATASDRLARNVSALRDALSAGNVSEDRITTTNYDLSPASERPGRPSPEGAPNETRYRAEQSLAVELDDVDRVGEIVDLAVANGATGVRGVEFRLSDERQAALANRALERAMGDARDRAETLAATEDLGVDGVVSVESEGGPARLYAVAESDAAAGTTIDPGPVTVSETVRVTYATSRAP